jgi:hypothetical protein
LLEVMPLVTGLTFNCLMTSRKIIESKLYIANMLYWQENEAFIMASKPCPKLGYVDKDFQDCETCGMCMEKKK